MVQIIKENTDRRRDIKDKYSQMFGNLSNVIAKKSLEDEQERKEIAAAKRMGLDLEGLSPENRKTAFGEHFKNKGAEQKKQLDTQQDQKTYNTIKKYFGEDAAEIYLTASEGGKTNFLSNLMDMKARGQNLEDLLEGQSHINNQQNEFGEDEDFGNEQDFSGDQDLRDNEEMDLGERNQVERKPSFKAIDYDRGKTPAERNRSQENRYKINLPHQQESHQRRQALNSEKELLDIMEELSPQISAGQRLNINPKTGDLIIPAAASPEAQRYIKTVNEFTTNAKDSYGARVTNFDLQQFMRRLPTLANSEEGRNQIIQQMKLINQINAAYENELNKVVDEHGGIRNIDWDRAESIAEKRSTSKIKSLKKQFRNIGNQVEKSYQKSMDDFKKIVPKGHVAVERADGNVGYIEKGDLEDFLKDDPRNRAL